jgi:heme A synthase
MRPLARLAWGVLAYDVAVVAWGAYVRATGSGAGCGRHWPMCNGEIVPRAPRAETLIELSHRITSGGAFLLTVVLAVWALRSFPPGHRVRRSAGVSVALMATEALIGAGLVLFELVAHDASMKRVLGMSLHLINTFLLLGSTALTAWWASGGGAARLRRQGALVPLLGLPLLAMIVVGMSGAVTALGDTLFPAPSVADGLAQDFSPSAPLFVRLRTVHPILAVTTAVAVIFATTLVRALRPTRAVSISSKVAGALVVIQVAAGLLDVVLRAPVAMQLIHLALADLVWIALVLTAVAALAEAEGPCLSAALGPTFHRPAR